MDNGWVDEGMNKWMIDGRVGGWMNDEWVDVQTDGWRDGWAGG